MLTLNSCPICTYTIKLTNFSTVTLTRSIRLIYVVAPTLHTMETGTLVYLESLIKRIQVHTQLTIIYTGFVGEKWPPDLRLIKKIVSTREDKQYLK
jgi:hypothetical protein